MGDINNPMGEKSVRVIWGDDSSLEAKYVNHVFVSHAGEAEFHITFGHLKPPLTHNLTEDELPDVIKVEPVSQIVVSPKMIREIIRVLSENLEKYESRQKETKE